MNRNHAFFYYRVPQNRVQFDKPTIVRHNKVSWLVCQTTLLHSHTFLRRPVVLLHVVLGIPRSLWIYCTESKINVQRADIYGKMLDGNGIRFSLFILTRNGMKTQSSPHNITNRINEKQKHKKVSGESIGQCQAFTKTNKQARNLSRPKISIQT